jgi:cation diffusion facilitator CzcD-associated flavoprotein CzcO
MTVSNADGTHVDVLVVGAGISGVDAACRLTQRCPDKSWLILEARSRVGGTWDLFRFPGVRSDSDMYTLGFPFRPWRSDVSIVGGPAIRQYVEDAARETGVLERIRFEHRVVCANWSSRDCAWTVEAEHGGETQRFTCRFLYLASGYYDYSSGHRPEWPGEADYRGRIVHPQFWPDDLDHQRKRVAVIGSGATAVTLVPALAERAAHVTMVQRTPSYIVARPAKDKVAAWLQRMLPANVAGGLTRWKNILLTTFLYSRARRQPDRFRRWVSDQLRSELGEEYPLKRDFEPPYAPWDQRLCVVPDADLFAAMRGGKARIATGTIERFIPAGLRLTSGEEIAADVIVTATGLNMQLLGGIGLRRDGIPIQTSELLIYKGMMLSGVPNLFIAFGYTNASWTLRSNLTARSVCRLLNHMRRKGYSVCAPRADPEGIELRPVMELKSGYVKRAAALLPKQGDRHPWRVPQNHLVDLLAMRFSPIGQDLEFWSRTGT